MTHHIDSTTPDVASPTMNVSRDYIREIHHQIKNNLQIVCSLLRLESRNGSDSVCKNALKRSENRVQSMALLYDFISRDSDSLQVPVEEYVKGIVYQAIKSLGRTGDRVHLDFTVEPFILGSKAAMSLGLIIHELVWEVLHRLPADDAEFKLLVCIRRDEAGAVLEIQHDFGSAECRDTASLSSQIVGALVHQFNGELVRDAGLVRLVVPASAL